MAIGILALQGAFAEHETMLDRLGAAWFEIRQKRDLEKPLDGLILPGGESTVMGKLLRDLDLFETLQEKIRAGLPVYGTCAGLILLADQVEGGIPCFATMDQGNQLVTAFHPELDEDTSVHQYFLDMTK